MQIVATIRFLACYGAIQYFKHLLLGDYDLTPISYLNFHHILTDEQLLTTIG